MRSTNGDAESRLRQFAHQVAQRRRSPPASRGAVAAIKQFQRDRLARAHADLLQSERYRLAARFFLDELYGVKDFSFRDEELARMIPSMSRLLPSAALGALADAIELDAISEELDQAMAALHESATGEATQPPGGLPDAASRRVQPHALPPLTQARYDDLYRAVGRRSVRARQIDLVEEVGRELDRLVGKPFLFRVLKGMEGPARLAGLGRMQSFLVAGFEAFRHMRGAEDFIRTIAARERALMAATFSGPPGQKAPNPEALAEQGSGPGGSGRGADLA